MLGRWRHTANWRVIALRIAMIVGLFLVVLLVLWLLSRAFPHTLPGG